MPKPQSTFNGDTESADPEIYRFSPWMASSPQ